MISQTLTIPHSFSGAYRMPANWFALINGNEVGPFTDSQLRELAASGDLQPFASVRKSKESEWALAKNIRGLFADVASGVPIGNIAEQARSTSNVVTNAPTSVHPAAGAPSDFQKPAKSTQRRVKTWVAVAVSLLLLFVTTVGLSMALRPAGQTQFQVQLDEFISESQRMIEMMERKTKGDLLVEQLAKVEPELLDLTPATEQDQTSRELAEELYRSLDTQRIYWGALTVLYRLTDEQKKRELTEYAAARERTGECFFRLTGRRLFATSATSDQ
jgi:hypothetical protein